SCVRYVHVFLLFSFFLLMIPSPLSSTLFPYTTLFRSSPNITLVFLLFIFFIIVLTCGNLPFIVSINSSSFSIFSLFETIIHIIRSEEHTSELQSRFDIVCRLLLETKNYLIQQIIELAG